MSETAPEAAQPEEQQAPAEQPVDETDWKAEARKWEQRAKDNKKAADQIESQRKASMTEAERAVVEAEQRGRTSVLAELGRERAANAFSLAAARRNPEFDASSALDLLDLGRFVGEDGQADAKAITAAVDRLVPVPSGVPSFDGGARQSPPPGADMNLILRRATGRA